MEKRTLTLGHSPDPDDAFMFYGLASGQVDPRGWKFEHILQDIQTLNERAQREELDITAVSIHAFAYIADKYALLSSGASMGDNYGPMVVAREAMPVESLKSKRIAIPGTKTSAFLALTLAIGKFEYEVVPFDEILDLGEWWMKRHSLPLPLGGNVVRRALGDEAIRELSSILQESIRFGLEHRAEAVEHSLKWARGMGHELADEFVGMYVNDYTLDYGVKGRKAVELFLQEAAEHGIIPQKPEIVFVG